MYIIVHAVPVHNLFLKKLLFNAFFLFTVGKQDAKCGHLGTTFAVFIHLSSTFAGWWNFVFQKIIIMLIIMN